MIFLSILAKTFALALVHPHPWLAAACWVIGALADGWVCRKAFGGGGAATVVRNLAVLQIAALIIGWGALGTCDYAALRWKGGIPVLAAMVGGVLRLIGLSAGTQGGMVDLTTMAGPLEFAASIDRLGLRLPMLFWVMSAVWLGWAETAIRDVLRKLGIIAAILLAVTVVCSACQLLLALGLFDFIGYESEELPFRPFMDEATAVWIYLPFLLAAGVLLGRVPAPPAMAGTAPSGIPRVVRWAAIPVMLAACGIIAWEPRGTPKTGKLVMSSYHAQWSRPDRPYDRDWYGADSGYNYACMKRFFGLFYQVSEAASGPLRAEDLAGASVLVIYDPDRRFSQEEIDLVQGFVRGGGGLLAIGDHTNVFGTSTHLNEICEPFGFQFRDDVLFDLDEDFHQMMYPSRWPSQFWHGMSLFKLRGPTSIRPTSWATRCTYQVGHAKGVRAIYSVNNFYPPPHDDPKMTTGTFCVSAASHYGSGRVAAWGDSTVFSNFEIFYPGKHEFLLNTVNWLNHQDGSAGGIARRTMPLILLAGLLLFLAGRREPRVWLVTVTMAVACFGVARTASLFAEERRAEFPKPIQPSDWVVFAATTKDPAHNLRGFVSNEPYNERYEVFIQWVLRTGAYPGFWLLDKGAENGLFKHLESSDITRTARALIVRKPADMVQLDEVGGIPTRAKDPLLLMFASTIPAAQAVEGIQRAGLVKDAAALARVAAAWPAGEVEINDGERRVLVIAGAERFSDQAMGISEKVVPDAPQKVLFNQAFGLVDRLFGRGPTTDK